jgi:predicted acyltransferase
MNATMPLPVQTLPKAPVRRERLLSLDALRGFDMFWIVGGEELLRALARAWPIAPLRELEHQMSHSIWEGVTFYDLIFPLFIFIVGVSLVFALGRSIERNGKAATLKRVLIRSLTLYALGLFYYGGISKGLDHLRWLGVLQRIALCYLAAGVIFCLFRLRGAVVVSVALLVGYWALTTFVPIRDFNLERQHLKSIGLEPDSPETAAQFRAASATVRGRFEDGLTLPQQLDFEYLPGFRWDGAYDPEGLLSTLPAVATCLFGVLAGILLTTESVSAQKKAWLLFVAGAAGVALGFLWGFQFPIIKRIWTSSYALVAGGYSCLLLGAFYQVVEIWQWRTWCRPFVWIGMNPITIYLAFNLLHFDEIANRLVGGPVQKTLGVWGELLHALVVVGIMLALVRFLYQRKVFLRL